MLALALLAVAGCSLDRTGVGAIGAPIDAGEPVLDARPRDATMPVGSDGGGAGEDAAISPIDSGREETDAGPPPIDAGTDAGTDARDAGPPPGPRPCTTIYGAAPDFTMCGENETECQFYVNPPGDQSCDAVCASFGGSCVRARDNGWFGRCDWNIGYGCDDALDDAVCTCSRS